MSIAVLNAPKNAVQTAPNPADPLDSRRGFCFPAGRTMATPMSFLDLFGTPQWARDMQTDLATILNNQEILMATIDEALQGWRDYTDSLNAHITDLTGQLEAAQATVQQLQDTDAAEDAAQAQQLTDQIAQQISDALTAAQSPPEAPPVTDEPVEPETPAEPSEETPAEETPAE